MKRSLAVLGLLLAAWLIALPFFGQDKNRDEFAGDRVGGGKAVAFDGKRAMGYLKALCDIGPRMSGTPGMKKQQELIKKHFEDLGYPVRTQKFEATQKSQKKAVEMTNLIVSFFPDRDRRVILCSHYDTRPIADQEDDKRKWREPFLSANDGGSGVAFLMEMAHHMKDLPTKVGVDFVFFDGEEYIFDPRPKSDEYFFGSKYFARTWKQDKDRCNYIGAVLLDMIAGKGARFPVEPFSAQRANKLCHEIWDIAAEMKCNAFIPELADNWGVSDDHISLLDVDIPALDIIDFNYKHWHKLSDVPANCAPEGMEQVSRVLSVWMQRVK
jgi:hypothetical protein